MSCGTYRLTGVLNQGEFLSEMSVRLRDKATYSLALVQIDRFRHLGDMLGRVAIEEVMQLTARCIQHLLKPSEIVGHIGRGEFAVLLDSNASEIAEELLLRTENMRNFACEVLRVQSQSSVSVSVGAAQCVVCGPALNAVFQCADVALFEAKKSGRSRAVVYTSELGNARQHRKDVAASLARDLKAGLIEVYYQPICQSVRGSVAGAEALARWRAPGIDTSPGSFVSIAEEYGLIDELWRLVVSRACQCARKTNLNRATDVVPISVNLSPTQLQRSDLGEEVAGLLAREHCRPEWLTIEITESALLDGGQCTETLGELTRLGVRLSIDDFGTGYSNFGLLSSLPVSSIKVDASLIRASTVNQKPVLKPLVQMAHELDLVVVAEGVECWQDLVTVQESGCDLFQGFFASKPMDAAAFQSYVSGRH